MGILERIKDIEKELAHTQKNKATTTHIGLLKSQLARLRTELLLPDAKGSAGGSEGFDVAKSGDGRVALIGFPSVGKSSLLNAVTDTQSEAAAYEFTTLTCIPGNVVINDTKIQMLDLPGIIEGASSGKGRGREVIAVARSADLILMVLDATKEQENQHRNILTRELETMGIRLNRDPPGIYYKKKVSGGVKFNATCQVTSMGDDPKDTVCRILASYRIHNAEVLIREDCTVDDLIDVIEGNRKYIRCLYVSASCPPYPILPLSLPCYYPHSNLLSSLFFLSLHPTLPHTPTPTPTPIYIQVRVQQSGHALYTGTQRPGKEGQLNRRFRSNGAQPGLHAAEDVALYGAGPHLHQEAWTEP